jgi:hypothetical protein
LGHLNFQIAHGIWEANKTDIYVVACDARSNRSNLDTTNSPIKIVTHLSQAAARQGKVRTIVGAAKPTRKMQAAALVGLQVVSASD